MAEVVLFHHVQGLTPGVAEFAGDLHRAGHRVHTPDLFDGRTFGSIEAGQAFVEEVGFEEVIERGVRAAGDLPAEVCYAGFSMGGAPAQKLAQTRPGACGALLFHSCLPAAYFGSWPDSVAVQIHSTEADPFFVDDGDIDAARALVAARAGVAGAAGAELFLYPGDEHLFADSSLAAYRPDLAALLRRRVLDFLASF